MSFNPARLVLKKQRAKEQYAVQELQIANTCLILSGYNGSPDIRFSREMTRLMSWPDRERYSCPQQSLIVPLLPPLVSTLIFSRIGGVLSNLNFSTHRFFRFLLRNLRSLVMFAVCCLVFRLRCNRHSLLLNSDLSSFGRTENTLCSACGHLSSHSALSSYGLFVLLALYRLSDSL